MSSTHNSHTVYVGHEMVDQDNVTIGSVTDVMYGDDESEPKWLVVKPGLLHAERFVPIAGSYTTEDGSIVVPFDKKWVTSAPKAGDHVLTAEVESEAAEHYDLTN